MGGTEYPLHDLFVSSFILAVNLMYNSLVHDVSGLADKQIWWFLLEYMPKLKEELIFYSMVCSKKLKIYPFLFV